MGRKWVCLDVMQQRVTMARVGKLLFWLQAIGSLLVPSKMDSSATSNRHPQATPGLPFRKVHAYHLEIPQARNAPSSITTPWTRANARGQ